MTFHKVRVSLKLGMVSRQEASQMYSLAIIISSSVPVVICQGSTFLCAMWHFQTPKQEPSIILWDKGISALPMWSLKVVIVAGSWYTSYHTRSMGFQVHFDITRYFTELAESLNFHVMSLHVTGHFVAQGSPFFRERSWTFVVGGKRAIYWFSKVYKIFNKSSIQITLSLGHYSPLS